MATLNGPAAASRMLAMKRNTFAACLYHTWEAYGFPNTVGKSPGRSFATAMDSYNYTTRRHAGDWNPPVGVPVWFGVSPSRTDINKYAGDVGISVGGGKAVFTDFADSGGVHNTYVGVMTLQDRAREIDRPYLGWTEDFGGNPIAFTPVGGSSSSKGTKVLKHYHYEDRQGRKLAPGGQMFLNNGKSDLNVVGGIGTYSITPHVYVSGLAEGDSVQIMLVWENTKYAKPSEHPSGHYAETVRANRDGNVNHSVEFKRGVAKGDMVFVRVTAPASNVNTGTVTLIDSDAYLYN